MVCFFLFLISFDKVFYNFAIDFRSFYLAGVSVSQGLNPYEFSNIIDSNQFDNYVYPYVYTPFLAEILSFFDGFEFEKLLISWRIFSILLFGYSIVRLVNYFDIEKSSISTILILLLSVALSPVRYVISSGQVDLVILSLLILNYLSYKNGKMLESGFYLALAIMIKIFPLLLLVFYLIKKKRVFLSTLIWIVVFLFLSVLIFDVHYWEVFINVFLKNAANPNLANIAELDDIKNSSLLSLILYFDLNLDIAMLIQKIVVGVSLVLLSAKVYLSRISEQWRPFSLFLLLMLLGLPFLWRQHFIYLYPFIFILLMDAINRAKLWNIILCLLIGAVSYDLTNIIVNIGLEPKSFLIDHYNILVVLFIFVLALSKRKS